MELTHFKDNFFTRVTDQAGFRYWNEKTLSDFLGIPDGSDSPGAGHDCPLDAGPVIFRMVSYLGAFPFQNTLAPSVLTFEAMVKVVVLLTERYGKVLRRARRDRIKLLFGSLADVGRKDVGRPAEEDGGDGKDVPESANSHAPGFSVDQPANDEYGDDDDDDLALAALESLDAIEIFKHDRRIDKMVYEARISRDTFRRLLMLLIVISPLRPLESVRRYTSDLNAGRMDAVRKAADSILAAFVPEDGAGGIGYQQFADIALSSLPYLFDPLTPLFEHVLFSQNLDLSQTREAAESGIIEAPEKMPESPPPAAAPIMLPGSFESLIMNSSALAHLSFFLSSTSSDTSFIRSGVCLHPVFSTAAHGSSLTSFSHHVLTWQSSTLLVLQGSVTDSSDQGHNMITLGAYLPKAWKSSSKPSDFSLPCLFQLSPKHLLLPGNPSPSVHSPSTPDAYFSTNTGIAIGCKIPPSSRSQQSDPIPHGAGSLLIDNSLDTATFHVSSVGHNGVFLPPTKATYPSDTRNTSTKKTVDIYTLEVWGLVPDESSAAGQGSSAIDQQRAKWNFEARDAERRRNLNFKAGGDSSNESARWLLESAGLIGGARSGGSV